ncbi:N-6 DNA methylase [filamentous cyanobacterium LEGE 11480]|uniref:site-specific DNA-methyltransferase (adenine-specific) n=1 Tax=Romeriopsis navalis LEGE 11480 TaxID=2777977 RepID=A0A928VQZ0_9CYAN|nr:class I SAM-dependent DNA methyltransferase [Romeriopsis navalis]MBE9030970.1 N-6 DNA methylase [Romeriopsis navalis LEGE 11480]
MSLSATVKSIQDIMRKDVGVDGDAQRIGQLGWMLFYKIFSDQDIALEAALDNYQLPIPSELQWSNWVDVDSLGKEALTGDELLALVDGKLFPTLKELDFQQYEGVVRERGALLRSVFEDAYNYMKSGTLLRQVVDKINDNINFNASSQRDMFGDMYEQLLKDLQGAGNAGEFYTPRALTQFAIDMVNPQLGEKVIDPACGTGGFLTCAFDHLKAQAKSPNQLDQAKKGVFGIEKKPLPHLLCMTNMLAHEIEVPTNIRRKNTLSKPLSSYMRSDQVDVVVTNPPFGGMEEEGIEDNFPSFKTRETADLFLVLVMRLLKDGGRAAIVLPDGTLFGEGIKTRIKEKLLRDCNLHTIVRLPNGVFAPYTSIKTNLLFFTKGKPTKEVWYYEHPYPKGYKSYSKTKPMRIEEFEPEKAWWEHREENEFAWKVSLKSIQENNYNLDVKNPNAVGEVHEDAAVLLDKYQFAVSEADKARSALQAALRDCLE